MNRIKLAIIVVALAVVMTLASGLAFGGAAEATGSCAGQAHTYTPASGSDGAAFGDEIAGLASSGPGALAGTVQAILAGCG